MASDKEAVPDPATDLMEYLQHLQARVQPLTRSAAQMPGPSDLSFHRSLDRTLARDLDSTREEVLQSINALLGCVEISLLEQEGKRRVQDDTELLRMEDLIDAGRFERRLGDAIDTLLERTDTRLDEYLGKVAVREGEAARMPKNSRPHRSDAASTIPNVGPLPSHLLNAPIRPLPQERFKNRPDNSREQKWEHSLSAKPHAKVPLTWKPPSPGPGEAVPIVGVRQGMYCAEGDPHENPYFYEIKTFSPPEHALTVADVQHLKEPPRLRKDDPEAGPIPFHWVNDHASFDALYDHLAEERVKEVAIDVEHHNFRSYQGLVCLVQVSTRWQDFIIDALSPMIRDVSPRLNDIFADPSKVKILHGAEHDVLWLQRDLGLYLVGLFDTYHATNVLNFSQHGLAFLLSRYIDFIADKRYQLADWRIRPLPKEMLYYARSDTHSLIHIYDCLRFEIAQQQGTVGIRTVFEQSKKTANKTYAKEQWDDGAESREGWRNMWKRLGGEEAIGLDSRWEKEGIDGLTKTERLFRALHDWRDQIARKEDDSPRYILSSTNMLNLASRAPDTKDAVLSCIGPSFKKRVEDLHHIIVRETREFNKCQARKAERQRILLEKAAAGQLDDEEMGEVVERGEKGALLTQTIWPGSESDGLPSQAQQHLSTSSLASLLFSAPDAKGESFASTTPSVQRSLFVPMPKAASNEHLLQSIRRDLSSALGGLFGGQSSSTMTTLQNESVGEDVESAKEPESSISRGSSEALLANTKPSSAVAVMGEDEQASSTRHANGSNDVDTDDGILRVRKTKGKKNKKRALSDAMSGGDGDSGEAGSLSSAIEKDVKKRKWTKQEKAERKLLQQQSVASVEPFDYSKATSVLESQPAKKERSGSGKGKGKSADGKGQSKQASIEEANRGRQGRYANVPVGRDRREQAGGKSMSFAH